MKKTLLCSVVILLGYTLYAQISFERSDNDVTTAFRSGVAVMSVDVNGDTYDDLVRLNEGTGLCVSVQTVEGSFFTTYTHQLHTDPQWNLTAGDLNNDGWMDFVTSGAFDHVKVFRAIPHTSGYDKLLFELPGVFAQSSNIVDVNNDGFLDIFICNDIGTNVVFINDSTGNFNRNEEIIDFDTQPPSDNSGNYSSIWTDFDSDGDLDLYIAKCKIGVEDPSDPRRVNALYVNIADTAFVEMAADYGIATGRQSWTADFADIDNDGDMDLFVANHDGPSQLFENLSDTLFEEITVQSGIAITGLAIQSVFRDFDNDGLVDLLVGGTDTYVYRNTGNNQFVAAPDPFPGRDVISYAIGDFNADGFHDVYAVYNEIYNKPSNVTDDAIWLNAANDNNYLRLALAGVTCNASAIGTRLQLFGEWGIQTREIRAGESYGITNTLTQIFGVGHSTVIDSLVVTWPHGGVDVFYNLEVNETYMLEEGGCKGQVLDLEQGPYVQCGSDTFTLTVSGDFDAYLWNNGMEGQTAEVWDPGVYFARLLSGEGCAYIGGPVLVEDNLEVDEVEIALSGNPVFCQGESIVLEAPAGEAYLWSTGSEEEVLEVAETGSYTVTITRPCSDIVAGPVDIIVVDADNFTYAGDTIDGPGSGILTAFGDSVLWYAGAEEVSPLGTGPVFQTPDVDSTTTFYVQNIGTIPGVSARIGMEGHAGSTLYNGDQYNGSLTFDAMASFTLDSVRVFTDTPGRRTIVILDDAEDVYYEKTFDIEEDTTYLHVDAMIEPGQDYRITTNADTNNAIFGTTSPQLVRSDDFVLYPYTLDDVASIKGTESGVQFYYYFYDWHITTADKQCVSARYPVALVVDSTSAVGNLREGRIRVFPNPVVTQLHVDLDAGETSGVFFRLMSVDGRVVTSGSWSGVRGEIDMGLLRCGLYVLEVQTDRVVGAVRVVKY